MTQPVNLAKIVSGGGLEKAVKDALPLPSDSAIQKSCAVAGALGGIYVWIFIETYRRVGRIEKRIGRKAV